VARETGPEYDAGERWAIMSKRSPAGSHWTLERTRSVPSTIAVLFMGTKDLRFGYRPMLIDALYVRSSPARIPARLPYRS